MAQNFFEMWNSDISLLTIHNCILSEKSFVISFPFLPFSYSYLPTWELLLSRKATVRNIVSVLPDIQEW